MLQKCCVTSVQSSKKLQCSDHPLRALHAVVEQGAAAADMELHFSALMGSVNVEEKWGEPKLVSSCKGDRS